MFDQNQNKNIASTNFQNISFREKFLLNINLAEMARPESARRATVLNSVESSTSHNLEMITNASKEFQKPIHDVIEGTRAEITKFAKIPRAIFDGTKKMVHSAAETVAKPFSVVGKATTDILAGTTKIATQLVTNPIGLALNIPRMGADLLRLAARPPLIAADYLAQLIGKPSTYVRHFKEKALLSIEDTKDRVNKIGSDIRDKILGVIEGFGGHGGGLELAHAH